MKSIWDLLGLAVHESEKKLEAARDDAAQVVGHLALVVHRACVVSNAIICYRSW